LRRTSQARKPARPVRIIVGLAACGSLDILTLTTSNGICHAGN
jgi:tripartite-type tricarboxylate transporter receptor subunit TctC